MFVFYLYFLYCEISCKHLLVFILLMSACSLATAAPCDIIQPTELLLGQNCFTKCNHKHRGIVL